ncbi:MAG TPA: MarR family transcriptional regulator [Pyrinomonadaceae bacterium]|nr:MarR family transcriptional regulator [Pyrinomonadaceae bacterium]HMP65515.1 MarR family transcriptional regulator [Pyrinomonadaceae bacterium]
MSVALQKELQQTKPFASLEEAAYLSVLVTAERFKTNASHIFKQKDLTAAQYNVLRILRGAGEDGISCTAISGRMITRDSDITRMLDRLEARGLISRRRQADDRRVVKAFITEAGLGVLSELDGPVGTFNQDQMADLSEKELRTLIKLLEKARGGMANKGEKI